MTVVRLELAGRMFLPLRRIRPLLGVGTARVSQIRSWANMLLVLVGRAVVNVNHGRGTAQGNGIVYYVTSVMKRFNRYRGQRGASELSSLPRRPGDLAMLVQLWFLRMDVVVLW